MTTPVNRDLEELIEALRQPDISVADIRRARLALPSTDSGGWLPIESAPRDGTWILGVNNRGNCAVIIWDDKALDHAGRLASGWIHPFSDSGSIATHWQPLPPPPKDAT